MDVVSVAGRIESKVRDLETARGTLDTFAKAKAIAAGRYAQKLAIVILELKNGKELKLHDEPVKDPPATIMEKIAKGICANEQIAMDLAEAQYKVAVEKCDCIRAELNGWQSINRHLDNE